MQKYERTFVLRRRMWYNIISRIKEKIDYNMDLDNNAHSVFLVILSFDYGCEISPESDRCCNIKQSERNI